MKKSVGESILIRPDSTPDIQAEANKLLKRARVLGIYPTPISPIIEAASLEEIDDFEEIKESFLKSASAKLKLNLTSAFSKLRGLADLKRKAIFVTPDGGSPRENWARLHEIGHQWLPWQNEQYNFIDDSVSLSTECVELFDVEANAFASELLFQGPNFRQMAKSYRPEFETIFQLARLHGASIHATARRFAEECDEPIALISYYPSKYSFDESGAPLFMLGRAHSASVRFVNKYGAAILPDRLSVKHPWLNALTSSEPIDGSVKLENDGSRIEFLWNAWWNQHRLLVLIRRKPTLTVIRKLLVD